MFEFFKTETCKIFSGMFVMSAAFWIPFGFIVWIVGAAMTLCAIYPVAKPYVLEKYENIKARWDAFKDNFSFLRKEPVEVEDED